MKIHHISIKRKYFEPVRKGIITLLIFNKKIIYDAHPGDYIQASFGAYDVKAKIARTYIKSFKEITQEEAKQAGFLTKDFLKDELIKEFELEPKYHFGEINNIDDEIFFLIKLHNDEEHHKINSSMITEKEKQEEIKRYVVNKYQAKDLLGNRQFYNPEYDSEPWRDL